MFITKARHEREIAAYATDLKRANEARDNWRDSSKENEGHANEWEAKFRKAIADLEPMAAAFSGDVLAVIDTMTDYRADSAEQIAADASHELGLSISPARVSAIRKALHTLDLADFGALYDDDSTRVVGRGYWLTQKGAAIQKSYRDQKAAKRAAKAPVKGAGE